MINKDLMKAQNAQVMQKMYEALQKGDVEAATAALQEMQTSVAEVIEKEFEQYKDVSDIAVLQSRGLRALTSEETEWYQKFIKAVKSGAKQEITNLTGAIVPTVVDRVIEDMKKDHELLGEISFVNAAGAVKLVMNGTQMASKLGSWGAIGSAISTQVAGQLKLIDVTKSKYTAYFLIPKDFTRFNFGFAPMWVDQYIRIILGEVIANGLERTIISGDGDGQFIGMTKDTTTSSNNKYSDKTPVAITDWDDSYADVVAGLAVDGNGDDRNFAEVILVVNQRDYIKKVRRAQNAVTPAGVLDLISNTYPTRVVRSMHMPQNKAVVGIAKNYFAAINGGVSGVIEYSDENQFLEDNRVYSTRIYGGGQPVDNTSFAYLDISGVEAPALPVKVKGTVKTKEQA